MEWTAWSKQSEFIRDQHRIRCLLAGKRAGKTEPAYIDLVMHADTQPDFEYNGVDPYLVGIIAPTEGMLKRLVVPKFRKFAAPFEKDWSETYKIMQWNNPEAEEDTLVYLLSAESIERIEGLKMHYILMTESFQMKKQVFLEALARTSDAEGRIVIEGSLGPKINNPKRTWIYENFVPDGMKEKTFEGKFEDSKVWTWTTAENPHFPQKEIERMKRNLDKKTFEQMFEISWDIAGENRVYQEFNDQNLISGWKWDPLLETSVAIDWGWAHPMACLFFQYSPKSGKVVLFDEIVESKMKREELWKKIKAKGYRIDNWYCDISGKQERESGTSNINWFAQSPRNVSFQYSMSEILQGIPVVRRYIKSGDGRRRFFVDQDKCPKSVDGLVNYSYPEKDGTIASENPIKKDDDCVDAIRYYFFNRLNDDSTGKQFQEFNRWTW